MAERALRRELKFWEALAMSVGIMAPTLAMSLNGVAPAGLIGQKVPLAFLLAFAGVALVAYGFVRLTRYVNHAGSVYALVGTTIGPRAGFVAGWALLGFYFVSTIATFAATGLFGTAFLKSIGISADFPWLILGLLTAVLAWLMASREVRVAARSLLTLEGLSVGLIVILVLVILVRVIAGSAPDGQTFDLSVFTPGGGISFSAIMAATVFGFLSWAGFEGTAALGEETGNPRRDIPRALVYAVGVTGALYLVIMFTETIGFGANAAGAKAFASSAAPLNDLASSYVGSAMAKALDLGATASAFACVLGSTSAGARLLFAFSRDGWGPARLSRVSEVNGAPAAAIAAMAGAATVAMLIIYLLWTKVAVDVYFYVATMGVLALLIVYAMASIGAIRFLFFSGPPRAPRWEMVVPILGVAYLVFVFYKQFSPKPASPYDIFPFVAIGWTLLGFVMVLLRPQLARQTGLRLAEQLDEPAAPAAPVPAVSGAA